MKTRAISVNSMTIRDKRSGQPITLCRVFVADGSGRIGSLYTRKPVKAGEEIEIGFQVERDGKIKSRII